MLTALELRDFAIVDELRLDLAPGLNALTGETGAGKSLLVDAVALLVGQRADAGLVRSGAASALVQGLFSDLPFESAARRLQAEGGSAARIDGEVVTVGELAQRVGSLVAVHGQHAALALSQKEEPRRRLDRMLAPEDRQLLEEYRKVFATYRDSKERLERLREESRERERRRDTLTFELEEIDAAKLAPGQDAELREEAEALRHAHRIVQGSAAAVEAVSGDDRSAIALLALAARELDAAARHHPALTPLSKELHDARAAVQATAEEIESFLAEFQADPAELERVESKLARIQSLERKYGDGVDAILAYRESAAAELRRLAGDDEDAEQLAGRVSELERELATLGSRLSAAREGVATTLGKEVERLLAQLGMPGARFEAVLEPLPQPGPHGLELPRFEFGANPGEPLANLGSVASGGELSRVMLALDVLTGSDRPVLVFDEVDAGVGGEAALAVGELLRRLSRDHQVLVVTHLPQVAAYADAQYYVQKQVKGERTVTRVNRLEPHEREQELARMLSGSVTEASLRNARELVAAANSL